MDEHITDNQSARDTSTTGRSNESEALEIEAVTQLVAEERQRQGIAAPREPERVRPVVPPAALVYPHEEDDEQRKRRLKIKKQLHNLTLAAGEQYRDCMLDTFQINEQYPKIAAAQSEVKAGLRTYCETMPQRIKAREGIVAYGPCGTGKDHLICAAASGAIRVHAYSLIWLNGQAWFGQLRDRMGADESEMTEINRLVAPDILVISDPLPPVGSLTAHQSRMLCWLLDARYRAAKVTWCTINIAAEHEGRELLGVPVWERLIDRAWEFFFNWPSYRRPVRQFGVVKEPKKLAVRK